MPRHQQSCAPHASSGEGRESSPVNSLLPYLRSNVFWCRGFEVSHETQTTPGINRSQPTHSLEIECRSGRNRIESLVQHVVVMRRANALVIGIVDAISR